MHKALVAVSNAGEEVTHDQMKDDLYQLHRLASDQVPYEWEVHWEGPESLILYLEAVHKR